MIRIQKLPSILPRNVMFSTESIYIDDGRLYPIREESYITTGASFFIDDKLEKYVITVRIANIVIDCIFVGFRTENGINKLYPIMMKVYKLYNDLFKQNKSTILLKKGIEEVLSLNSPKLSDVSLEFVSKYYLKEALRICYPIDEIHGIVPFCEGYLLNESNLINYTSDINLLNYLNNESNPGIEFSFSWFLEEVQMNSIRFPADPSRHIDLADSIILESFSPTIPTILLKHPFTTFIINKGSVNPVELLSRFGNTNIQKSDDLHNDPTLHEYLYNCNVVYYAGSLANSFKDESLEIAIYSLYEKIQTFPYIDGYIRYILLNRDKLEVDSSVSYLSNFYTSNFENKVTNSNYVISIIEKELASILEFNPFGKTVEVEIIIRDYVVIITFISETKHKWAIVYDLVLLGLISKSLMIIDDNNYLNGVFDMNSFSNYNFNF